MTNLRQDYVPVTSLRQYIGLDLPPITPAPRRNNHQPRRRAQSTAPSSAFSFSQKLDQSWTPRATLTLNHCASAGEMYLRW